MNSRERVLATLAYEEPDYVPIYFLGFTSQWVERLVGRRPTNFVRGYLPVYERFDSDVIVVGPDIFYPYDVYATEDRWMSGVEPCELSVFTPNLWISQ